MSRRDKDFYETPGWAVGELLHRVRIERPGLSRTRSLGSTVLECCAGENAITERLALMLPNSHILTNDIDTSRPTAYHADMTRRDEWVRLCGDPLQGLSVIDWVISNPPFALAPQIVPLAFEFAKKGVAILLRSSFTEPTFNRQDWLAEHSAYLSDIIFLPRISFTGNGKTDSVSCNWYVWQKSHVGGCRLHWVRKPKGGLCGTSETATAHQREADQQPLRAAV